MTGAHRACNQRTHEHSDNVAVCCMESQLSLLQGYYTRQMQMCAHASAICSPENHLVTGHAGVGSALAGDAVVELIETGSLTAAVDQAMVSEPADQELTGSPRDMDYDAGQQDPSGGSPVSDENNTDFAAVHSVLSAIEAREPTSD